MKITLENPRPVAGEPLTYLAIPGPYIDWLGGLQWSDDAEAIEYRRGQPDEPRTFAMLGEVVLFLEGLAAGGPVPCFGHVIHFLDLFGVGRRTQSTPAWPAGRQPGELRRLFRECGRPFRNAGALAAHVGRGVPRDGEPVDVDALFRLLEDVRERSHRLGEALTLATPEVPPLSPLIFSARVLKGLAAMTSEEVGHWLKAGRPPAIGGQEIADLDRPRSLAEVLAAVEKRPRMAAASGLAGPVLGALTIPPRRLSSAELPIGGYADVANRGHPDQILLSQFALEPTELLRRFAEKELLYYRREEPRTPSSEELLVVLDQGVRTWGAVRSVLAAAVLAMGRLADRRGLRFRVVTTSEPQEILDPLLLGDQTFGERLESSDLSPSPAQPLNYLAETLADGPPRFRDVVLLTHLRSLREPTVLAASAGLPAGTRLFAVAVDDRGEVGLSELRHGGAAPISRCRVPMPTENEPGLPVSKPATGGYRSWTGDVEPVPFPFRLGLARKVADPRLDLDPSGQWLFVASYAGVVHAWRVDGGEGEILPRGAVGGRAVFDLVGLVGVSGGVLTLGRLDGELIATHYDLSERRARVHPMGPITDDDRIAVCYLRDYHCVLIRRIGGPIRGLDLGLEPPSPARGLPGEPAATPRLRTALRVAEALEAASAWDPDSSQASAPTVADEPGPSDDDRWLTLAGSGVVGGPLVSLDRASGILSLRRADGRSEIWRPLAEGKPLLAGCCLVRPAAAGSVVAIAAANLKPAPEHALYWLLLFERPGRLLRAISGPRGFALSKDGRRVAFVATSRQVVVQDVAGAGDDRFVAPVARVHGRVRVVVGRDYLVVSIGGARPDLSFDQPHRMIGWGSGVLEWSRDVHKTHPGPRGLLVPLDEVARGGSPRTDRRFVAEGGIGGIRVRVDHLGQILVNDRDGNLVAMFFVYRNDFAAWMPDGTRLGPPELIGGEPTPDAARKIGQAMLAASRSSPAGNDAP